MNWSDTSSPSVTGTSSSSITSSESSSQSGTSSSSISGLPFLFVEHNPTSKSGNINIGGIAAGSLAGLIVLIACMACIYQWIQRRRANA